jgi:hypothetical protein
MERNAATIGDELGAGFKMNISSLSFLAEWAWSLLHSAQLC